MLTHPTLDQLRALNLDGMVQAFIVNGPRNLPTFGRAKFPTWRGW